MDAAVGDLEVAFLRLILSDVMTYVTKICQIGLYNYVVLNTHNLDMILQLKYMPIVMNPGRMALGDWKSQKCYGLWYGLSSKRV